MKKMLVVLVLLICAVSLVACGEKYIEDKIKKDTGVDIDISNDGENVTLETDDQKLEIGNDLKWPENGMGDIPKLKGNITFVGVDEETCSASIALSDVKEEDAKDYLSKLKELGYDGMNMSDENGITFIGENQQGSIINFTYNKEAKESMVAFTNEGAILSDEDSSQVSKNTEGNKSGISYSVPDGWEEVDGSIIIAHYMKNTVSFMIKEEGFRGSVDDVIEQSKSAYENAFDTVEYIGDVESLTVGGNDARGFTFTCEVSKMKMKFYIIYTILDQKTYAISFGDMEDTFDDLSDEYAEIVESIAFEN